MWIHVSYHFFGVDKFVITVIVPQTYQYCHWGCNEGNDGCHRIAISGCVENAARIRFGFDLTFACQSLLQIDARHHQVKGVVPFSHDAWSSHSGIKQALRLAKNWLNLAYFRYTSIGITLKLNTNTGLACSMVKQQLVVDLKFVDGRTPQMARQNPGSIGLRWLVLRAKRRTEHELWG